MYRSSRSAGTSYFFTLNLADRSQALLTEHIGLLRSAFDYTCERHVDYIHINPAEHGLVLRVADWPHSSFQCYVRVSILPKDWARNAGGGMDCGERV